MSKPYIMIKTSKYCSKPSIKNLFWEIASSHGILPMHVKGNPGFGDNLHDILGDYLVITDKYKAFWCDRAAALDIARANEFKAINLDAAMFHFVKEAADTIEKKDEMIHSLRQALKFMSRSGG